MLGACETTHRLPTGVHHTTNMNSARPRFCQHLCAAATPVRDAPFGGPRMRLGPVAMSSGRRYRAPADALLREARQSAQQATSPAQGAIPPLTPPEALRLPDVLPSTHGPYGGTNSRLPATALRSASRNSGCGMVGMLAVRALRLMRALLACGRKMCTEPALVRKAWQGAKRELRQTARERAGRRAKARQRLGSMGRPSRMPSKLQSTAGVCAAPRPQSFARCTSIGRGLSRQRDDATALSTLPRSCAPMSDAP